MPDSTVKSFPSKSRSSLAYKVQLGCTIIDFILSFFPANDPMYVLLTGRMSISTPLQVLQPSSINALAQKLCLTFTDEHLLVLQSCFESSNNT